MNTKLTLVLAATLTALLAVCPGGALAQQAQEEVTALPPHAAPGYPLNGGYQLDAGTGFHTTGPFMSTINGAKTPVYINNSMRSGVFAPDGSGNYIWYGSNTPVTMPNPSHAGARELKLKVRELAAQLLSNEAFFPLGSVIALPTSFVNQDDFNQTSSFGRYIAEQMYYEFNQRGVPVREYRIGRELVLRNDGEFMLTRQSGNLVMNSQRAAVLVGTYYFDGGNVFVNARLINGVTGMVIRTAMTVFQQTPVTRAMMEKKSIQSSSISLRDFTAMTSETDASALDLGEDVH